MIVVVNYSHPLSQRAIEYLNRPEVSGDGGAKVVDIKVHVDLNAPLILQVQDIFAETMFALEREGIEPNKANVDCIVPPGLGIVAALIGRAFPRANLILLRPDGKTPPVYEVGEIVHPYQFF